VGAGQSNDLRAQTVSPENSRRSQGPRRPGAYRRSTGDANHCKAGSRPCHWRHGRTWARCRIWPSQPEPSIARLTHLKAVEAQHHKPNRSRPSKRCVMNSKLKLVGVLGGVWLSGCASQAHENSNNRSAADYQLFDCAQLAQHARDLSAQAASLAGWKKQNCSIPASSGTVVFWPAAFTANGPNATELSDLRSEFEAARQASLEKNCAIQFLAQAPEWRAC
jgi:hypothetical protein